MSKLRGLACTLFLLAGHAQAQQAPQGPAALPMETPPATPVITAPISAPTTLETGDASTDAESWRHGLRHRQKRERFMLQPSNIGYEIFFRTGPSFIFGGGELRRQLNTTGWNVQAGGRSLFFNPEGTSAWTVDLGLNFIHNNGGGNEVISVFGQPGTVREVNRTAAQVSFGKEIFTNGNAFGQAGESFWRYGWEAGMRYGTGSQGWEPVRRGQPQIGHKHDVFGGTFLAGNLNLEVPMGGTWSYVFGLRAEWGYTYSDLLPGFSGTLHDFALLFNTGLRF
jgi:hypothetical protein